MKQRGQLSLGSPERGGSCGGRRLGLDNGLLGWRLGLRLLRDRCRRGGGLLGLLGLLVELVEVLEVLEVEVKVLRGLELGLGLGLGLGDFLGWGGTASTKGAPRKGLPRWKLR